mgnify:CR=1 FL=1
MIMNGINIYPGEIERVFEAHPEIAAAAAFPVKSKIHGQIPVVAIEPAEGARLTERELLLYAKEKLGVRGPRKIVLVDVPPRNAMGKVLKTELAAGVARSGKASGAERLK